MSKNRGHGRKRSPSSSDSPDSAEEERLRDLKERDAFSDRLKKKDEGKTRKVVEVCIYINSLKMCVIIPFFKLGTIQ